MKSFLLTIVLEGLEDKYNIRLSRGMMMIYPPQKQHEIAPQKPLPHSGVIGQVICTVHP